MLQPAPRVAGALNNLDKTPFLVGFVAKTLWNNKVRSWFGAEMDLLGCLDDTAPPNSLWESWGPVGTLISFMAKMLLLE